MKDFPSLSEFLQQVGVSDETPREEMEALKKKYAKAYQVWYHRHQRKQNTHRYTLRFSNTEWAELNRTVKRHTPADLPHLTQQTDLASFIKQIVLSHISKKYVPVDPQPMTALTKELQVANNRLGQIQDSLARLRRNQLLGDSGADVLTALGNEYENMQNLISGFTERFTAFMHSPPLALKQALKEYLKERPDKVGQLIEYLLTLNEQKDAGNKKHDT